MIFPGKADSAIFLGFEYAINPQNLMKIVGAIFEKMKILIFFYVNYVNSCFLVVNVEEGSCSQFKNFQTLE